MADPLESAADKFLQSDTAATSTPLTAQAVGDFSSSGSDIQPPNVFGQLSQTLGEVPDKSKSDFISRNTQTDAQGNAIPLDVEHGMGPWLELQTAVNRSKDNQLKFLQAKFGPDARMSDTGEPIVRVLDSVTGKPKDVKLNPKGMDAEDLMDLIAQAPEIAAGFLAARSGKPAPGIWNALKSIGKMAIGSEAAGAAKDVGVRAAEGQPIDLPEIGKSRAEMTATDIATGTALAAGGKALFKMISPFSNRGPLQFDLQEAQDYFQRKYGVKIPTSPGETTGSSLLSRSEAMALQKPGSSAPLEDILAKKTDAISRIQKIALGLSPDATEAEIAALPTSEEVGRKAIGAIGSKNLPLESSIDVAKKEVSESGTSGIKSIVSATTGQPPITRTQLGESLQSKITSDFQAFQAQAKADYGALEAHPLAQERILPASELSARAQALKAKLPAKEVIQELPSFDAYGSPTLRNEKGEEVMREFVPSGVLSKVNELISLKDQNMKLGDLIGMRTEVRNSISQAEAIPGVKTHYLSEIDKMLTGAIKGGLDKLDDPTLKTLWETANNNYANGIKKFDTNLVKPLLKDISQPGSKGPFQIASEAINNPDRFFAYKEYYGANSAEFGQLKRGVADEILNKATSPASQVIDAKSFLSQINSLPKEVVDEVFRRGLSSATRIAEAMGVAEGSINVDELKNLASKGSGITGQKLLDLMSAQSKRSQVYSNEIRKSIGSGTDISSKIKPSEFVDNLTGFEPKDVKEVVSLLGDQPQTIEDIRSLTVQKILNAGSLTHTAADNPSLLRGLPQHLSSENLQRALGDKTQREIYRSILGQSTFDDLTNLTKVLAPGEMNQRAFAAAGGLSAGTQIAGLVERGELKYVDRTVRNFVIASIYTLPPVRALVTNTLISKEGSAAGLNYIIASTPFIEALTRQFGPRMAGESVAQIKQSLDSSIQNRPQNKAVPDAAAADRFLNQ